jgi:hypothetical protein
MSVYSQDFIDELSYEDSVLDAADDNGMLSPGDARKLVADHGILWEAWLDEKPMEALACEARPLLHFLGY